MDTVSLKYYDTEEVMFRCTFPSFSFALDFLLAQEKKNLGDIPLSDIEKVEVTPSSAYFEVRAPAFFFVIFEWLFCCKKIYSPTLILDAPNAHAHSLTTHTRCKHHKPHSQIHVPGRQYKIQALSTSDALQWQSDINRTRTR